MDERFIPLAAFVRGAGALASPVRESEAPAETVIAPPPCVEAPLATGEFARDEFAHTEIVRELALVRLAAHEAFARAKTSLLTSLGEHVLGRELALAPAELAALVARVVDASRELEPVSLVLSTADAERVPTPLVTRIDPSLGAGDFIVEVRDGALESPVRFRLQAALDRALLGDE